MKHLKSILFVLLLASPLLADEPVLTLNNVVATTSTNATYGASGGPVLTLDGISADVCVKSDGGANTFTVIFEQRAYPGFPYITIATMANCDQNGSGTVTPASTGTPATGPCSFVTNAPLRDTRLRVSAWTSGIVNGSIHVGRVKK